MSVCVHACAGVYFTSCLVLKARVCGGVLYLVSCLEGAYQAARFGLGAVVVLYCRMIIIIVIYCRKILYLVSCLAPAATSIGSTALYRRPV